jgi:uncharacterized membrane protein YdbT with pleckstrin-like domain
MRMRLQEGEHIIHELRPEPQVLGIWFFTKCFPTACVGAFLSFWCFGVLGGIFAITTMSGAPWPFESGFIIALIVGPVLLIVGLIYCIYLRRTYVYYVTNQRCVFHGGILRRIQRSVPYHKITDVEMSQNIIERVLGISSLKIFTPGTSSMRVSPFAAQRAEIFFVGLADNEPPAATINDILKTYKATGE